MLRFFHKSMLAAYPRIVYVRYNCESRRKEQSRELQTAVNSKVNDGKRLFAVIKFV